MVTIFEPPQITVMSAACYSSWLATRVWVSWHKEQRVGGMKQGGEKLESHMAGAVWRRPIWAAKVCPSEGKVPAPGGDLHDCLPITG